MTMLRIVEGRNAPRSCVTYTFIRIVGSAALLVPCSKTFAAVMISSGATQNMTCSQGVCVPTASDAVLNVSDLENLLAGENVEVTTTGSGVQANDIVVSAAFSWSTSSALTLDAYQSLSIDDPVSVDGLSGLTLTTDDSGSGGLLTFGSSGSVTFANLSSALTINGMAYTLVNSVKSLASAIAGNNTGNFAVAQGYNAKPDGTYTAPPILTVFSGTVEGLGNSISHLSITDSVDLYVGLFAELDSPGTLRDFGLPRARVTTIGGSSGSLGALVGINAGTVFGCYASGSVEGRQRPKKFGEDVGGLVGANEGIVAASHASASVRVEGGAAGGGYGGLVGGSNGTIEESSATGDVHAGRHAWAGGLLGYNVGSGTVDVSYATGSVAGGESAEVGGLVGAVSEQSQISNSYATGSASVGAGRSHRNYYSYAGGLIGTSDPAAAVSASYSTGKPGGDGDDSYFGGSIGGNDSSATDIYWDKQTSGTKLAVGRGGSSGIAGLTTKQLKSGLPTGFDPAIWGEQAGINHGLPYLLAVPPAK